MSEKETENEKVMTVTLMRSDLYDSPAYTGAYLTLPAYSGEIQDALQRARVTGDQPYQVVECFNMQGEYLDFIPDKPSLAELNYLAYRISSLDAYDRVAFTGSVKKDGGHPTMQELINLTYDLEDVHIVQAGNDRELGKFYVDNDFVDAVSNLPPENQEEIIELLDFEKIGRLRREAEKGSYVDGKYVVDLRNQRQLYDGVNLPEHPFMQEYIFELMVSDGTFYPDGVNECTLLRLPATPEDIKKVLAEQDVKSLDDCMIFTNKSSIPQLNGVFGEYEDIGKIKMLAETIHGLRSQGQEAKYKAALELMDCTDIDLAMDIAQNLNSFDFYSELSAPEEYAKQEFLKKYHIAPDDPVAQMIQLPASASVFIEKDHAQITPYGIIRTNDQPMVMEHSIKQTGQQML